MHSFRSQIREETHFHHKRVDDLFSQLNLAERADYVHFLKSQWIAFQALQNGTFGQPVLTDFIKSTHQLLRSDLQTLGENMDSLPKLNFEENCDATGVEYVLAGAHFGKQILRSRWALSSDKKTLSAGAYLQSKNGRDLWVHFTDHLESLEINDVKKDVIFNSARCVFDLFYQSYHRAGLPIGQSQIE